MMTDNQRPVVAPTNRNPRGWGDRRRRDPRLAEGLGVRGLVRREPEFSRPGGLGQAAGPLPEQRSEGNGKEVAGRRPRLALTRILALPVVSIVDSVDACLLRTTTIWRRTART